MRIADVSAFYTPAGGGVRTYVDAKLRAAPRFGHEMIVIAPGERHAEVISAGRGRPGDDPSPRCRSTAATAISTTSRALMTSSTPGSPTMSRRPRPGRARRWSAAGRGRQPLAGDAFRSAGRLCLSLARRLRPTSRSTAGSAGSGGTCAGSADVRRRHLRQRRSSRTAGRRRGRQCEPSAWASKPGCFRRRCVRRRCAQALSALGLDAGCHPARRHRPLLGREAVGHGAPRRRDCGAPEPSACSSSATGRGPSSSCSRADSHCGAPCCRGSAIAKSSRAARQRRRAGPRLRGRDILHGRGRSARQRHPADRSRPRRGADQLVPGAGHDLRAASKSRSSGRSADSSIAARAAARRGRPGRAISISPSCATIDEHFADLFARYGPELAGAAQRATPARTCDLSHSSPARFPGRRLQ
jgi:hypothetical protein